MSLRLDMMNEQDAVSLPDGIEETLHRLLRLAGESEGVEAGEVALTFVNDEEIRELNKQYRGLDKSTDVLSFSMWEGEELAEAPELSDDPIGDIVISAETAKRQSEEYGHSLEREIGFLFVHGFLHLIGYDHQDEASEKEMIGKQERVLQQAGLTR
ncbi:rRNA maturation RNase YbeY [Paenibacillus thermotolerans]|uniref:rRNA maturation RNase YbeY n=1 Tax=Paenibacillus thermotolerans TaxID=3027807 RepID=UPI002368B2D9|nr:MULTISPECIES: rRNA maturation RNase YbeY [unclassified Paenibacillus]